MEKVEKKKKMSPGKYVLIAFASLFVIFIVLAISFSVKPGEKVEHEGVVQNLRISSIKSYSYSGGDNKYYVTVSGKVTNYTEENLLGGTLIIPIVGTKVSLFGEKEDIYIIKI